MIICNLAVLLAERRLKISKVSTDTGISRTTLTTMYYDNGSGIQFDTLDKLCIYLDVNPFDLYTYYPFSLQVFRCTCDVVNNSLEIRLLYSDKETKSVCLRMCGSIKVFKSKSGTAIGHADVKIYLPTSPDTQKLRNDNKLLSSVLRKLPLYGANAVVRNQILPAISDSLKMKSIPIVNPMDYNFEFNAEDPFGTPLSDVEPYEFDNDAENETETPLSDFQIEDLP